MMKFLKIMACLCLAAAVGLVAYKHYSVAVNYNKAKNMEIMSDKNFLLQEVTEADGRSGIMYIPVSEGTADHLKGIFANMQNIRRMGGDPDKGEMIRTVSKKIIFYKNGFETDLHYLNDDKDFYTCDNYSEVLKSVKAIYATGEEESCVVKYYAKDYNK